MNIIIKYIISGGTAAVVDLTILNFLDSIHFHYLLSINIAFIFAFFISFSLQKYWTFKDAKYSKTHHQLMIYFVLSVCNVFLNNFIIHFLLSYNIITQFLFIRPIVFAQIISGIIIAFESFLLYRHFIFKKDKEYDIERKSKPLKILIITQKLDINDSYFGFFHDWIYRFSLNCEKVSVISLDTYKYDLPNNVDVLSLGKEKGHSKFKYLWLLLKYSFIKRDDYDVVFCHMSPVYVISGWLIWKIFDKKIALWYVHKSVDLKLRIAHLFSDIIFTSTKEGFGIQSKKVNYMGQAIDISRFEKPKDYVKNIRDSLNILTVGRITPIKNLEILIKTASILKSRNIPIQVNIIGATVLPADIEYDRYLKETIRENNVENEIKFLGAIANKNISKYYWDNDIFINLCPTGGLDKAVLEAMASGIPVIVSNKAFKNYFGDLVNELLCNEYDPVDCAEKIIGIYEKKSYSQISNFLSNRVREKSDLNSLIISIIKKINEIL